MADSEAAHAAAVRSTFGSAAWEPFVLEVFSLDGARLGVAVDERSVATVGDVRGSSMNLISDPTAELSAYEQLADGRARVARFLAPVASGSTVTQARLVRGRRCFLLAPSPAQSGSSKSSGGFEWVEGMVTADLLGDRGA